MCVASPPRRTRFPSADPSALLPLLHEMVVAPGCRVRGAVWPPSLRRPCRPCSIVARSRRRSRLASRGSTPSAPAFMRSIEVTVTRPPVDWIDVITPLLPRRARRRRSGSSGRSKLRPTRSLRRTECGAESGRTPDRVDVPSPEHVRRRPCVRRLAERAGQTDQGAVHQSLSPIRAAHGCWWARPAQPERGAGAGEWSADAGRYDGRGVCRGRARRERTLRHRHRRWRQGRFGPVWSWGRCGRRTGRVRETRPDDQTSRLTREP